MNFLLLMSLVFFAPLLLYVGSRFRTRLGGFSVRPGLDSYGQSYLRTMANSGSAMSEQIEMEDMLAEPGTHRHFEEDD
ncbi:hypothetical protein N7494_003787 [Penicillium frequentans]|uniref:Uncharacterized protein n=1 Tax=Penicillium frequentans TaxID=3151616 RepID=A0AAD6CZF3_9EURO|nr:hypothetical protein N7494_003787 [Penicillium glabrum]